MGSENDIALVTQLINIFQNALSAMQGAYVAQVKVLETPALAEKDAMISDLNGKLTDAQNQLATAQGTIADLTTQASTLSAQIASLQPAPVETTPPVLESPILG